MALVPVFDTSVAHSIGGGGTSITASVSTSGINRLLVATLVTGDGGTPTTNQSVSGGGITWSKVAETSVFVTDTRVQLFIAYSALQLTSQTITASWTTTCDAVLIISTYYNTDNLTGLVAGSAYATATNQGSPNSVSVSITTKKNNSFVVGGFGIRNDATPPVGFTAGTNSTLRQNSPGAGNGFTGGAIIERTDNPLVAGTYSIAGSVTGAPNQGSGVCAIEILGNSTTTQTDIPTQSYIQLPTDNDGKKVATQEIVQSQRLYGSTAFNAVERQEIIVARVDDDAISSRLKELLLALRDLKHNLLDALH